MGRAESMVANHVPVLPAYDHEQIAIDHRYNEQNLAEVYAELVEHRMKFREFYKALTDEQWGSTGIHPESGHFTMYDSLMQVGHHDVDHLEQITRILKEKR